jgi:peptidoglycan/LPS O-acetylase OafA/YrhL
MQAHHRAGSESLVHAPLAEPPIRAGGVQGAPSAETWAQAAEEATGWTRRHVPTLDGVRGIAVALVMAFHFTENAVPLNRLDAIVLHSVWTGWLGVDLFFVLSGFLITGILLDTRQDARYFRNFYARRTLRILPLYYAILVATLLVVPLLNPGVRESHWFNVIAAQGPWLWTYTSNVYLAIHNSWDVAGVLGHFWTLAVEEQFYVVWPAVVWLSPVRRLRHVCVAIAIGAVAIRVGLLWSDLTLSGYVLTLARADSLAIGAWVAASLRDGVPIARMRGPAALVLVASATGFAVIFTNHHPLRPEAPEVQVLGFTLLALASAAVIVFAVDDAGGATTIGRALRHPFLRYLGKYSYAMYCLHPLVKEILDRGGLGFTVTSFGNVAGSALPGALLYSAVAFSLTALAAVISWHILEKHFLGLKDKLAGPVRHRPEPERMARG